MGVIVGLHKVSIAADRSGEYSRKFAKEADAEIDPPSGDFVRGRFLGLSDGQLRALTRMRDVHLNIEGRGYKLVSIEQSGAFIAVKERGA